MKRNDWGLRRYKGSGLNSYGVPLMECGILLPSIASLHWGLFTFNPPGFIVLDKLFILLK